MQASGIGIMNESEKAVPEQDAPIEEPAKKSSRLRRAVRFVIRCLIIVLLPIGLYLVIVLIGLIPVNNDFEPTPDGVEVHLTSTAIHADIVLPIKNDVVDWRNHFPATVFSGDTSKATHVAIGWGDKGFYIGTPTWADLKASTVASALFWSSDACMHISLCKVEELGEESRSVRISLEEYRKLVDYIEKTFRHNKDGSKMLIANVSYGPYDAFFEAHGNYHVFNTCNCWTGAAMRTAGIRTGWFTPLPKTVFLYLPD